MRRVMIQIFFSIIGFLWFFSPSIYAQSPSPVPTIPVVSDIMGKIPITMPGINCGVVSYSPSNKCCYVQPIESAIDAYLDSTLGPDSILRKSWGITIPLIGELDPKAAVAKKIKGFIQLHDMTVLSPCVYGVPSTKDDFSDPSCVCREPDSVLASYCDDIIVKEQDTCRTCAKDGGVWTGFGCIYGNVQDFIQKTLFGWGIGLAGMISFLCIIFSAFQMQTSQGNAETIKKSQEMLTSCIMGLILIIFSVFILKIIGVDILKIPGFM